MKKKIKNLTQEEIDEVCQKYPYCSFGKGCPFKNKATGGCMVAEDIPHGEEEVEIEEDVKN